MIWTIRDDRNHLCPPYKIITGVQGYSVWINRAGLIERIGSDVATLTAAKALAETHAKKVIT